MLWIPSYFNAPINPEDRVLAAELRQKVIPWSRTPFHAIQNDPNFDEKTLPAVHVEEEEEEELDRVEPVPEWLELFFDLAWTVTFSGLSGNTPIKGAMTVVSFITFFILAWWLWTAQVIYDTKFYVNDAWHRFLLLIQFLLFGALAGFTSGFDVTVGFKEPEHHAGEQAQAAYVKRAFQAISMIFFVTRVILAGQYARVIRLARNRRLTSLYMIEGSLLASAILFLGAFLVTRADPDGQVSNGLKFAMWGMAVFLEVTAYCLSTMPRGLITQGSMPARLSTLTTVVIGEGLNGFIDPITAAIKSVGFNGRVAGQIIICGLIIFFVFIIYFQSFRARHAPTEMRSKFVTFAHFPVQLFIILLLEGLKSILNILTLENSLTHFLSIILKDENYDPTNPTVVEAFKMIGIDIGELNGKIDALTGMVTPEAFDFEAPIVSDYGITPEGFQVAERTVRNLAAAVQQLFKAFEAIDGPAEDKLNDYVNSFAPNNQAVNDTAATLMANILNDTNAVPFPIMTKFIDDSAEDRLAPAMWVGPIAGALLISLGIIMLVNGLARNRFAWWSFVSRIVVGICLCLIGLVNTSGKALEAWTNNWLLATIAIAYALLYIVDYGIAVLQARALAHSKQEFERLRAKALNAQHRPLADYHTNSAATSTSDVYRKWQPDDPSQPTMPRLRV